MTVLVDLLAGKLLFVGAILLVVAVGYLVNRAQYQFFALLRRELHAWRVSRDYSQTETLHPVLREILADYRLLREKRRSPVRIGSFIEAALVGLQVPVTVRIRRARSIGMPVQVADRIVRTSTSITIAFGLIGTFVGLMTGLINLKGSLSVLEAATDINTRQVLTGIVEKLKEPLNGMSLAFVTSVVGVGGSALMNLYVTLFSGAAQRDAFAAELEEFLENQFTAGEESDDVVGLLKGISSKFSTLSRSLEGGLTESAQAIQSLAQVLGPATLAFSDHGNRMLESAERMEVASTRLEATSSRLVDGLDRMDRTMDRVADTLGSLEGGMASIGQDSRSIVGTLEGVQHHMLEASDALQSRVGTLAQAEASLARAVEGLYSTVPGLAERFGAQVDMLRQQSLAFSGSLDEFQGSMGHFGTAAGALQTDLRQFVTGYEQRVQDSLGRQFADLYLALETLRRVLEQNGAESVDRLELMLETLREGIQANTSADRTGNRLGEERS